MKLFVIFLVVACVVFAQSAVVRPKRQSKVPPHADNSNLYQVSEDRFSLPAAHEKYPDLYEIRQEEHEDLFDEDEFFRKKRSLPALPSSLLKKSAYY